MVGRVLLDLACGGSGGRPDEESALLLGVDSLRVVVDAGTDEGWLLKQLSALNSTDNSAHMFGLGSWWPQDVSIMAVDDVIQTLVDVAILKFLVDSLVEAPQSLEVNDIGIEVRKLLSTQP